MEFYQELNRHGDKIALITQERQIAYQTLQREIDLMRHFYDRRALAFCVCTNAIPSVEAYLSFLQAGIPVALINFHIDQELLSTLMEIYRPYYCWAPKGYLERAAAAEHDGYELVLLEENSEAGPMHEELAVLLTTSGSTGSPKLVRQSYRNYQANTQSIVDYLKITAQDRAITTLPMHYTFGLSIINSHISAGASLVLTELPVVQPKFWELIQTYRVTTFSGVPYTFEMLKRVRFLERELPSLRYLTQAGGKLGKELHYEMASECAKKGIDFIVMYGQTEATARMSYVPADHAVEKAGSIGVAIPGGTFWLEDTDGRKIDACMAPGELIYQGDNVTMGYAERREDLALGYSWGDILHTGDVAQVDEDGYYYVVGRLKRFLKLFGSRVNMDEVEALLKKENIECVVCGQDDHMKVCVLADGDVKRAENYLSEHTAIPKFGFRIYRIDRIPRNEAGKILYSELEDSL